MPALFDTLYNESKDMEAERKKGFTKKKVERAFAANIDNLHEMKEDALNEVQGVQKGIANGAIGQIARLNELALRVQECDVQITELERQKKLLLG